MGGWCSEKSLDRFVHGSGEILDDHRVSRASVTVPFPVALRWDEGKKDVAFPAPLLACSLSPGTSAGCVSMSDLFCPKK